MTEMKSLNGNTFVDQSARNEIEALKKNGVGGVTFTPQVSPEGIISWTNNGGLDNPAPVDIKGPAGPQGATGPQGPAYTLTEDDKALIVAQVIQSLGGEPIFGYVDEDNNIIVQGNLADGTYTVKYEMEDGTTVDIGDLVLDSNTYYSVTKNLTNCTVSNSATQVVAGGSYSATITANSGYSLSSIKVTMGGTDISSTAVSGGTISITSVSGDVAITATAVEIAATTYTVTNNLTNCANSNSATVVEEGSAYSATITANDGYELESVTVTMGGNAVSVSGGVINIASVTGDIVITAVATETVVEPTYTNKIPLSTDTSGNPYNGGQGWKTGYRLSGSSGGESAQTETEVTGFIPVKYGDTVYMKGITDDGSHVIGFYDSAYATHKTSTFNVLLGGAVSGGVVSFEVNSAKVDLDEATVAFMRVSATEITANSIITVNEPIE